MNRLYHNQSTCYEGILTKMISFEVIDKMKLSKQLNGLLEQRVGDTKTWEPYPDVNFYEIFQKKGDK